MCKGLVVTRLDYCFSEPMIELSNSGASGSIFYVTSDDNFICKTVQHKEAEFLQKISMGYYLNLDQNQRTLLPKFFGLYCYSCNAKVHHPAATIAGKCTYSLIHSQIESAFVPSKEFNFLQGRVTLKSPIFIS